MTDLYNDEKKKNKTPRFGASHWFSKLDTQKWAQAYDQGYRYGWMTTNIVECIYGCLKGHECYLSVHLFN